MIFQYIYQFTSWVQSNLIDLVNATIVGIGVWVGYQGLTTWKRQIKGQDEYKLALEIMENAYDLEEQLRHARGRLYSYTSEEAGDKDMQVNAHYQQHADRVNRMLEASNKLRILKLRADTLWDRTNTNVLGDVLKLINQFVNDFEIFYQAGWDDSQNRKGNKEANDLWITLYGSFTKDRPDIFWNNFSGAIKRLEDEMKTKITLNH